LNLIPNGFIVEKKECLFMKSGLFSRGVAAAFLCLSLMFGPGLARADDGLPSFEESEAYQQYLKKPQSNLAKLLCGLNYFRTAPVMVRYDDVDYPVQFAYPLGLTYLLTHYHEEDPVRWIKKNCYRSPTADKIMYFKFPDGSYRPVREIFINMFHLLEKADQKKS